MTAKKTTTTKATIEKEIKTPATEVKATTSTTKATTSAKTTKTKASTTKKMTKDELVKKAMESNANAKEVKKPVEKQPSKTEKNTVKKTTTTKKPKEEVMKQVLFPDTLNIKDFGNLQKVETEDWEELKELLSNGAVILTAWNKKTIRNYDGCTPNVKVNDLYAYNLSNMVFDVLTPIYTKSTTEQFIAVSNFTEAVFIFYQFDVLDDAKTGNYRQSSDIIYEVYLPKEQ